ncbi:MAG TPA: FGGY family carbohydrate kinase [Actinomycetota bacterium]|nr:FGGY family carbohydrate kinase [Actinomycetota bacterium]
MELVVGVDLATADVRVAASDPTGKIHAFSSRPLAAPSSPRPGWWEQDAGSWWPATSEALRELNFRLGRRGGDVAAISVSATSGTALMLDASAEPIGPALTYADQRAAAEAEQAQAAASEAWTALGLTVAPSFSLPKWAWLLRHRRDRQGVRLAHASDVLVTKLTGALSPTDSSHALKSGYDPVRRSWVAEALVALDIDFELLPDVGLPGEPVGAVSRQAAEVTGLSAGVQVRLGMTDSCAAQLAAGAAEPGQFVSVLGSTLVLKGASTDLVADPAGAVYSHYHPAGWWLPGGASSTGGQALPAAFAGRSLAELDDEAAARGPAGVVTYPLLGRGERFPFAVPDAEGFRLGIPADEVENYRSILEGVAFVERCGYERLRTLGAAPAGVLTSAGRGSTSAVWNRIRATVLGRPIVAKPEAGTALGACILAASGTLHRDLVTATAAMSAGGRTFEPYPREAQALEGSYQRFLAEVAGRGWIRGTQ